MVPGVECAVGPESGISSAGRFIPITRKACRDGPVLRNGTCGRLIPPLIAALREKASNTAIRPGTATAQIDATIAARTPDTGKTVHAEQSSADVDLLQPLRVALPASRDCFRGGAVPSGRRWEMATPGKTRLHKVSRDRLGLVRLLPLPPAAYAAAGAAGKAAILGSKFDRRKPTLGHGDGASGLAGTKESEKGFPLGLGYAIPRGCVPVSISRYQPPTVNAWVRLRPRLEACRNMFGGLASYC